MRCCFCSGGDDDDDYFCYYYYYYHVLPVKCVFSLSSVQTGHCDCHSFRCCCSSNSKLSCIIRCIAEIFIMILIMIFVFKSTFHITDLFLDVLFVLTVGLPLMMMIVIIMFLLFVTLCLYFLFPFGRHVQEHQYKPTTKK